MNSLSLKHKSFLYSLGIHLLLGALLLALYIKKEQKHEVYSLINLSHIEICTPSLSKPVEKVKIEPAPVQTKEKVHKILSKPVSQPMPKVAKIKKREAFKTVELTASVKPKEIVPVKTPVEVEEVAAKQNEEIVEKVDEAIVPKESEAVETQKTSVVKEKAPVVAVSEPKLSSEAQYMQDNIALINALIKKHLYYPRLAKKRGLQGKAIVSFTLNLEGEVDDIKALGELSSILKKSAIKTVQKASSDFPHPSEVLALRIPIVYKLH